MEGARTESTRTGERDAAAPGRGGRAGRRQGDGPRFRRGEPSLDALRASSARLSTAMAGERRRIERDLHDGAQQRLVALRIRLAQLPDLLESDRAGAHALIQRLDGELGEALAELRRLASGLSPPVLADRGLGDALRSAGRVAPLPVTVEAQGLKRYGEAVESAVYFAVSEALQNAAKHATGATRVSVTLVDDGALRFTIADDGCGFEVSDLAPGDGLTNMLDRVVACGGTFEVWSARGRGTRITGTVPSATEHGTLGVSALAPESPARE